MDAEAVRQLRMGPEVLSDLSDLSDGSYRLCRLYCIISAGLYCWIVSYWLDWIVSYRIWLDQETLAFAHWLVTAWMGWMDWMGRWWDGGGIDGR